MSLQTTLRYEANTGNSSLMKALERQRDRIKTDELMAERQNDVRLDDITNLRSNWIEKLEEKSENQKMKVNAKKMNGELVLARQALIKVRQAALRKQISEEKDMYEKELHRIGKAFIIQRM